MNVELIDEFFRKQVEIYNDKVEEIRTSLKRKKDTSFDDELLLLEANVFRAAAVTFLERWEEYKNEEEY